MCKRGQETKQEVLYIVKRIIVKMCAEKQQEEPFVFCGEDGGKVSWKDTVTYPNIVQTLFHTTGQIQLQKNHLKAILHNWR